MPRAPRPGEPAQRRTPCSSSTCATSAADRHRRVSDRRGRERDSAPSALPANTILEPRVAAGLQKIFDGLDQRIADIIETGIDRSAYLQRVQVPRLAADSGGLVTPTRERFMPVDRSTHEDLGRAVRGLLPRVEPEPAAPGRSRSALPSALIHQPVARRTDPDIPGP
jgi:hypothetical protein